MNNLTSLSRRRLFALSAIALIGVNSSGCVRLAANLVHAIKGNDVPAEFTGMQGKKVAVVCATDEGLGADGNSTLVARFVRKLLEEKVEKIDVSSDSDVDQWILGQKSDLRDYADIGKGLGVDYVIAVNMHNLTLKNGSTLHRGNCDLTVAVYDIKKDGKVAFRKHIGGFAYPSMAAHRRPTWTIRPFDGSICLASPIASLAIFIRMKSAPTSRPTPPCWPTSQARHRFGSSILG